MTIKSQEKSVATDRQSVVTGVNLTDRPVKLTRKWFIARAEFDSNVRDQAESYLKSGHSIEEAVALFGGQELGRSAFDGNILLNEGINELWTVVCGGAGTSFSNANAYLGVGDSSTAESAAHTGLQASTNKLYKAMDGGYPTYGTSQKATWRATFGSSEANYSWQEFTVANGSSDTAKNLNRKVSNQGTKTSGQTWQLTLEITLS